MARDKFVSGDSTDSKGSGPASTSAPPSDDALRPRRLCDVIGQRAVVERLQVLVDAAKKRGECLKHILFDGPPGLGKTTLANVLPAELGTEIRQASGPSLTRPSEVMPYLTNLSENAVLFIDEIHRLPRAVEEFIYPAMEDFRVDIVLGEGLGARTISMPLKRFTLIGATTRTGMLSAPLRDRFITHEHLDFYEDDELTQIVTINAGKLGLKMDSAAAKELACRSRGTPRIANSFLHWVRDYAESKSDGTVTLEVARQALLMREIDDIGLDRQDRRYLETLIRVFDGGPAGVDALAATMSVSADTLSEEVEPFLLRKELIVRTPRGRRATPRAYEHLKLSATGGNFQQSLF